MRALVTGASGFVGRWLTAHLEEEGDDVVAAGGDVDVVDGEAVRKLVLETGADAVYHLAGRAHVGQSWEQPAETFAVNALGTVHVLDAARRLPVAPRVLVVSSAEVYGRVSPDALPLTEESPLRPVSPYAASKVAAEVAARQAFEGFGVPTVVARAFNHIGPGQSPSFVVPAIATRILAARRAGSSVVEIGNPTPRRDLTDVRDVVRAYRLLVAHGEPGATYNVCSGTEVEIGELVRRMIELAGGGLEAVTAEAHLRPVDVPALRGAADRLRDATAWRPRHTLDQSLRDVLAWAAERP